MMHSNYHMLIHLAWHGPEEVLDPACKSQHPLTGMYIFITRHENLAQTKQH